MLSVGCWTFSLLLFTATTFADDPPLLTSARRALAESAPQIAIQKLRTLLDQNTLTSAEHNEVAALLAEAQLADGRHDEALATIAPVAAKRPDAKLVQARIFADAGRWIEALSAFRVCTAVPKPPLAAQMGEAEALQALGRTPEAATLLEKVIQEAPDNITARLRLASFYVELQKVKRARAILDKLEPTAAGDRKWKQYILGRALLVEGNAPAALALFEEIIDQPRDVSDGLLAAATLASGEARAIVRDYDSADKPLETFIWRYPESAWLEVVFRRLDQIYTRQEHPGEGELQKWAAKQPPRCAALARFYVARMQIRSKKPDKAALSLAVFIEKYPAHPLVPFVHLMQADLLLEKRDHDGAVKALDAAERAVRSPSQRAEIELRRGLVLFQQGQFFLATNEFQRAASHSPKLKDSATFNAALAALHQQNYDRFLSEYRTLTTNSPESPLRPDLILEQGFTQARNDDPRAVETLQLFLNHFPLSKRQSEARLALAELAFQSGQPAVAAEYIRVVNASRAEPASAEQAEYLEVFLAEGTEAASSDKVIERAQAFIRKYPKSPLLPEVRMKLGQVFFHGGNFAGAETQFSTLAQESPAGGFTETALFLAGQSAMQSINPGSVDRALKLFDEVVKRDGPLKLYARQQQAIVQSKLGKESEAVILCDTILSAQPAPEPELRYATLAAKGENLLVLGRKDEAQLAAALVVFEQLAALPDVPPTWRNQALYKKADTLLLLNRQPEAITALYDVLDQDRSAPREYFWYYKAGFDLAALFEQQSNWKSAIGIYEKIARLDGPRSADATARAKDLRLKHFIWE